MASVSKSDERIKIDRDFQREAYEYNGWYYYANKKMGKFLYRVRTDGTGNEQLTDYSIEMGVAYITEGKLFFEDRNYETHSIKL